MPSILKRKELLVRDSSSLGPCKEVLCSKHMHRIRSVTFSPYTYNRETIKAKQQRLLLLHHALNCSRSFCSLTRHCTKMKLLWTHIVICNSESCKVSYCRSSRSILTHFVACRNQACVICLPVRQRL